MIRVDIILYLFEKSDKNGLKMVLKGFRLKNGNGWC